MKVIGLIIFLLASGCAAPGLDYEFRIFPGSDVDTALQAANNWEIAADHRLTFYPKITEEGCSYQYCIFLRELPEDQLQLPAFINSSCSLTHAAGCTVTMPDTQTSHTVIRQDLTPHHKLITEMHELGHGLGLYHRYGDVIMNPDYSKCADHITWGDVVAFWELRK